MSKKIFSGKIYDVIICLALVLAMAALALFPKESVEAARNGVTLCLNVIIPSLFPFFVLSRLMVELGLARQFGRLLEPVMRTLFNVNGSCSAAFVLGFIGGYPVGASTAINLYKNGSASKTETERLLAFCNNSGPAFILGVVGAGIFSSSRVGILLYLAHILASIVVGIMFRSWGKGAPRSEQVGRTRVAAVKFSGAFTESVKTAFSSTLNICGFVLFFTVVIRLLFLTGILPRFAGLIGRLFEPIGMDSIWAERLLTGIIELTSGVWSLQSIAGKLASSVSMAAFMLGWAGLSIHCQVLSFIGGSGLSVRSYVLGKLIHGVISSVFVSFLARIFPLEAPVASYLAEQVTGLASLDFATAVSISTAIVALLLLLVLCLCVFSAKRSAKRGKRRGRTKRGQT